MKTKTDTTSTTKSKAAANTTSARKIEGGPSAKIDDKRQQSGKITQLQEMANGSGGGTIQREVTAAEMTTHKQNVIDELKAK
ncbi:MAG: hypothetical protein ACJASL_000551 [Paraglaciecola sp.]|jgi:hypothetical protein